MTDRSAPRYANAPPSEQSSRHKKVKRPTMPALGHTACSGVIASLLRRRYVVGRKGYRLLRRSISLRADDPISLLTIPLAFMLMMPASFKYAAEDVKLYSRRYIRL